MSLSLASGEAVQKTVSSVGGPEVCRWQIVRFPVRVIKANNSFEQVGPGELFVVTEPMTNKEAHKFSKQLSKKHPAFAFRVLSTAHEMDAAQERTPEAK